MAPTGAPAFPTGLRRWIPGCLAGSSAPPPTHPPSLRLSDSVDSHYPRLKGGTGSSSASLLPSEQVPEISLWEQLGQAAQVDIDSSDFSWDTLSSLHHTEHTSSTEHSEDEMNKALEVAVNSGAVG